MKYQWLLFKTALMFFTRIPVGNLPFKQSHLQASARFFTWVGLLVGIIGAITLVLADMIFSPALAILFSMIATILLTGSFHEDGFADCCDAFGGGWTNEKILTIMKDSRLGTYGVVGLILILSLKFLLLLELMQFFSIELVATVLITAHANSRFWATNIMQQLPYVQDIDSSKSKPLADRVLTMKEMAILLFGSLLSIAVLFCLLYCQLPLRLQQQIPISFSLNFILTLLLFIVSIQIPSFITQLFAAKYFKKWIGGYTGDCLGATQQVCEIAFYLGCLLLWKFI
ncbi:adenosylcobinamide-GDP ribazoletransferase [Sediminibacterium sp.]|uniref:adenosylcobinamide-GDP ribazoletransferase n=1 Tax=Sediminibacterium sp. TaxID=1917865 RepID=UPI003F6EAF21